MTIFLIGFMGCGKTTVGKKLAKKLGRCHPGIYIMAISIKKQILQSTANLERKGT